ncbi:hypothetical protein KAH81_08290 [bacterium]|nr:hypothetical protein [bacterium]
MKTSYLFIFLIVFTILIAENTDCEIYKSFSDKTILSDIFEIPGSKVFVCHKLGECPPCVIHYEEYFLSSSIENIESKIYFYFLSDDTQELKKFINGYRTSFNKGGVDIDCFLSFFSKEPPKYWPFLIIQADDSLIVLDYPSPKDDGFEEIDSLIQSLFVK